MAWLQFGLFILALAVLVKSSSLFVHYAAKIAKRFGVSEFVIGLTLVAIGTSLPELMNTIISSMEGVNDFALGNILGSNMANMGLSVGFSVLLATIVIMPRIYRREVIVLFLSTTVFVVACADGWLSRDEGFILALMFIGYILYVAQVFRDFTKMVRPIEFDYFVRYLSKLDMQREINRSYRKLTSKKYRAIGTDVLGAATSALFLILGSHLLVDAVIKLAEQLGVTNAAVGATLVAIGTTTPELSVSIASVRRGYHDMLFGNIIGSNIVNLLLIMGIGAFIHPIPIMNDVLTRALPILCVSTLLLIICLSRQWTLHKLVGATFVALYAVFLWVMWFL